MFKNLRFRLTVLFVLLASVVYIILTAIGFFYFQAKLDVALRRELQILLSEIAPGIDSTGSIPKLMKWEEAALDEPFERSATVQLFSNKGELIAEYGLSGCPKLYLEPQEDMDGEHNMMIYSRPLYNKEHLLSGYLQVQLPTAERDRPTQHFLVMLAWLAPLLLASLGFAGYIYGGHAMKPIEESFEVLKRFMLYAGHELATPVSIIQVNADALEEELAEKSIESKQLPVINRATERMDNIIKGLTLLAKMESPEFQFKQEKFRFDELARQTTAEFEQLYKDKGVALETGTIDPVSFVGDTVCLKLVISNLLNNALRYSDKGSKVTVSLNGRGHRCLLTVADTGVGIEADQLPYIFDHFFRVNSQRTRAEGGSGLGLAIVKTVVEAHNGTVTVDSAPGKGSTFAVSLPNVPSFVIPRSAESSKA